MTSERKVAVITGASRGIGAALLRAYRDIGYHVVATSRSIDKNHDPSTPAGDGDIARGQTADRIVGLAIERYGRIDTLINKAGVLQSPLPNIPKPTSPRWSGSISRGS